MSVERDIKWKGGGGERSCLRTEVLVVHEYIGVRTFILPARVYQKFGAL